MKAIILAAGKGSRLGSYTEDKPKCLLPLGRYSILERQINTLRLAGINDITVVKGFAADKITLNGVKYYVNPNFNYNMVYSLFCAEPEIEGDIIISYGDIIYETKILSQLLSFPKCDVAVIIDKLWKNYFEQRTPLPFEEAESLIMDRDEAILNIGEKNPKPADVQGQYIGLIRLSSNGSKLFKEMYHQAKAIYWDKPWLRTRIFQNIYMTDYLQFLIDMGIKVQAVPIEHGWLEFDTVQDYHMVLEWIKEGSINKYCKLDD